MDQQTHYLTWMKNKYITTSHFQTSMSHVFNNSWDDQTFVDDVAFIWPPRSYTCSFCNRKFRSAQALGGHMNVHRRDRAKLKLSPTSQNIEALSPNQNYHLTSNPNPTSEPSFLSLSSPPCDVLDQNIGLGKNVRSKEDSRLVGDDGAVNLTIGLNLVISNHNEGINKRHKSNVLPVPLFLGPCSKDLDLELRLGDSPKRK